MKFASTVLPSHAIRYVFTPDENQQQRATLCAGKSVTARGIDPGNRDCANPHVPSVLLIYNFLETKVLHSSAIRGMG